MRNAWYWFYSNFFQCSLDFHILLIINFPMIIVFVTAIFSAARNIYLLIDDFSEPNSCMENGGRDRINCSDVCHTWWYVVCTICICIQSSKLPTLSRTVNVIPVQKFNTSKSQCTCTAHIVRWKYSQTGTSIIKFHIKHRYADDDTDFTYIHKYKDITHRFPWYNSQLIFIYYISIYTIHSFYIHNMYVLLQPDRSFSGENRISH